ncbi:hypothetical protein BSPWISOXPB_3850 [uncultured Gammaproteobacteria bacterium]|nr:hypothetical protein BSPWISOXPB_3850 [uncultured Gammaproteobacteria bacterium]
MKITQSSIEFNNVMRAKTSINDTERTVKLLKLTIILLLTQILRVVLRKLIAPVI